MIVCSFPQHDSAQEGWEREKKSQGELGAKQQRKETRHVVPLHKRGYRLRAKKGGRWYGNQGGKPVSIHPAVTSVCPKGVQTEGMEGSLCWCAITHKVLFLRSLVITKTFRPVFSLFISQFMNEPISAESYGPDGDAITATISSGSFNFIKALCYDNRVSCKCQPILERINSSGGKLSFVTA